MNPFDALFRTLKVTGTAAVLHKPGAVRLDGYPLLVYAPGQHGPGIRTEDNGTAVEDVCRALPETPDMDALAARFGTTAAHARQAAEYGYKAGFLGG